MAIKISDLTLLAAANIAGADELVIVDKSVTTTKKTTVTDLLSTNIPNLPLTTPKITTSINDANGNEVIVTPATASAVNEVTVTNAATTGSPRISASGGDTNVHLNLRGKGLARTVTIGAGAATIYPFDFVLSGCVWTADSVGVNLNASMTVGVVVINGNPINVSLVTARGFTTNVDTYIDVLDNGDGTGLLVYTTAATNAASPALAANSIRIGIIQAAGTITATTKVNQGEEDRVFPIASSIPYAVTDSLGNLICSRDPQRRTLGQRRIIASLGPTATSTSDVDLTGLSVPVIVPLGRKILITFSGSAYEQTGGIGTIYGVLKIKEGATVLKQWFTTPSTANFPNGFSPSISVSPSVGLHTYKAAFANNSTGPNCTIGASATDPAFIRVELV